MPLFTALPQFWRTSTAECDCLPTHLTVPNCQASPCLLLGDKTVYLHHRPESAAETWRGCNAQRSIHTPCSISQVWSVVSIHLAANDHVVTCALTTPPHQSTKLHLGQPCKCWSNQMPLIKSSCFFSPHTDLFFFFFISSFYNHLFAAVILWMYKIHLLRSVWAPRMSNKTVPL